MVIGAVVLGAVVDAVTEVDAPGRLVVLAEPLPRSPRLANTAMIVTIAKHAKAKRSIFLTFIVAPSKKKPRALSALGSYWNNSLLPTPSTEGNKGNLPLLNMKFQKQEIAHGASYRP